MGFINRKFTSFVAFAQRLMIKLIEDIRLIYYFYCFVGIVVVFALAYYYLTPLSNGIYSSNIKLSEITLGNAVYFSVVTISSLGYGDFQPLGFGKVLASVQVLIGLLFIGIMIAKLTSFRLSYHVSRLYGSELHRSLNGYFDDFVQISLELSGITKSLGNQYIEIPNQIQKEKNVIHSNRFKKTLLDFRKKCEDLNDYISNEHEKGAFFNCVSKTSLVSVAESIDQIIFHLQQFIIGLPTIGRQEILDQENRKQIASTIAIFNSIYLTVKNNCKILEIVQSFNQANITCMSIPESLITAPRILSKEAEQPEQKFEEDIDEPYSNGSIS